MNWDVGATPAVVKKRDRCRAPGVLEAFADLVDQLQAQPRFVRPDKKTVWGKAWRDIPNHRHADLPGAWRVCWTIRRSGAGELVTILFLGTHGEYEQLYRFGKQ